MLGAIKADRLKVTRAREIIHATIDALTDAEAIALARRIRCGQTAPLTGAVSGPNMTNGPEAWGIDPKALYYRDGVFHIRPASERHPSGCACLRCREKVM